jgi:hypothetical protein
MDSPGSTIESGENSEDDNVYSVDGLAALTGRAGCAGAATAVSVPPG